MHAPIRTMLLIGVAIVVALAIAACGDDDGDSQDPVAALCDTKEQLTDQVASLRDTPRSDISVDLLKQKGAEIRGSVEQLGDDADELGEQRRGELEDAVSTAERELKSIEKGQSVEQILRSVAAAIAALRTGVREAFAGVDCPA